MVRSVFAFNVPSHCTWPSATIDTQESCLARMTTLMEPPWSGDSLLPALSASGDWDSAAFAACDEDVLAEGGVLAGAGGLGENVCCVAGLEACRSELSPRDGLCFIQNVQPPTTRIRATSANITGTIERLGFSGGELLSFS